jgi:hypothetical protein
MGKKHIGSSFDDFLAEEAMLEESTAVAIKRVIAWQIAEEMQAQRLTKTALAKKMHTSRGGCARFCVNGQSPWGAGPIVRKHNEHQETRSTRRPAVWPAG